MKIDFEEFLNFIEMIKGANGELSLKDYQNYFYSKWTQTAPPFFVKIMEKAVETGDESALDFKNQILGMGSKLKSVTTSNLCVSSDIPPDCGECYFNYICKIKL